ncbi:MAG: hypothetical protein RBR02_09310 [Desulfuromonadaceae bacterium]|nr:hypothetical protein [Desulfuromonadaceae bacterium]
MENEELLRKYSELMKKIELMEKEQKKYNKAVELSITQAKQNDTSVKKTVESQAIMTKKMNEILETLNNVNQNNEAAEKSDNIDEEKIIEIIDNNIYSEKLSNVMSVFLENYSGKINITEEKSSKSKKPKSEKSGKFKYVLYFVIPALIVWAGIHYKEIIFMKDTTTIFVKKNTRVQLVQNGKVFTTKADKKYDAKKVTLNNGSVFYEFMEDSGEVYRVGASSAKVGG